MQIAKDTIVTIEYEVRDENNEVVDKPDGPVSYLHGGYDGIFPLVEEALEGKNVGDTIEVSLTADDAFGELDEELIRLEPLDAFPVDVEVDMMFEADDPKTGETYVFRVVNIADGQVVIDANHPLSGLDLNFTATVKDVKAASDEEVQHGHAHGEHGHHHH